MMDQQSFQTLRRIVHDQSGIHLREDKSAMVAARLAGRLRSLGLASAQEYLRRLKEDQQEIVQLLDAISTNVTRFFREKPHFEFLDRLLDTWLDAGLSRLRIWSAAASSGQEPYSIAISVAEALRRHRRVCDFRLLGTDISTRVLTRAQAGLYSTEEIDSIPETLRRRYVQSTGQTGTEAWQIDPRLRQQMVFRRMNLNEPPFPMRGPLDVIFCCNVMIYFDATTKRRLLEEAHRLLRPDGFLLVSHTESLTGLTDLFAPVQPAFYRPLPRHALLQKEGSCT